MSHKKKSMAQKTAALATSWMPQPLADFFATPLGASLFMVAAPVLLATGVITINWSNGSPSVTFDRERATVIEQRIEADVQAEAWRVAEELQNRQGAQQSLGAGPSQGMFEQQPQRPPQLQPQAAQTLEPIYR